MATLHCPSCGNTRQWRNITLNSSGTSATCGACGSTVAGSATSSSNIYLGNVTTNGTTVVGDHQTVVGTTVVVGGGDVDPAWDEAMRAAQEAGRIAREAGRAAREAGRAARDAARQHGRAPASPAGQRVFDGPVVFGTNSVAVGPGAQAFGPGSRAVDTSRPQEPAHREPAAAPPAPRPAPARTAVPTPATPAPAPAAAAPSRPRVPESDSPRPAPAPVGPHHSGAAASGPGEITGLGSAMRYAHSMGEALAGQAQHVETFVGTLRAAQVAGTAVTAALRAQELTTAAAAAWSRAHAALDRQTIVREAYSAAPESGTKRWVTNG